MSWRVVARGRVRLRDEAELTFPQLFEIIAGPSSHRPSAFSSPEARLRAYAGDSERFDLRETPGERSWQFWAAIVPHLSTATLEGVDHELRDKRLAYLARHGLLTAGEVQRLTNPERPNRTDLARAAIVRANLPGRA